MIPAEQLITRAERAFGGQAFTVQELADCLQATAVERPRIGKRRVAWCSEQRASLEYDRRGATDRSMLSAVAAAGRRALQAIRTDLRRVGAL